MLSVRTILHPIEPAAMADRASRGWVFCLPAKHRQGAGAGASCFGTYRRIDKVSEPLA